MQLRLHRFQQAAAKNSHFWLACTFLSHGLFYDWWLRSKLRVDGGCLSPDLTDYDLVGCFADSHLVSGWNAAAGLPKSDFPAIAAGSCFLLVKDLHGAPIQEEIERIAPVLNNLELTGVGERRAEGFGECSFCDSLHVELRPEVQP